MILRGKIAALQDNRTPEVSRQPGACWSKLYYNYKVLLLKLIENLMIFFQNLAENYIIIISGYVLTLDAKENTDKETRGP